MEVFHPDVIVFIQFVVFSGALGLFVPHYFDIIPQFYNTTNDEQWVILDKIFLTGMLIIGSLYIIYISLRFLGVV